MKDILPYLKEISKKWHWVFFCTLLFSSTLGYYAYLESPSYVTYIQFGIKKKQTISALLSAKEARRQKRLNRRKQIRYCNQIVAMATSDPIMKAALLEKVNFKGREDFLANHIISTYQLFSKEKINTKKLSAFIDFEFKHADIEKYSLLELKALRRVKNFLKGKKRGALKATYNVQEDLLTLSAKSTFPSLPELILQTVFEQLNNYYLEKEYRPLFQAKKQLTERFENNEHIIDSLIYQFVTIRERQHNYLSAKKDLSLKRLRRPIKFINKNRKQLEKDILALDLASLQLDPVFEVYQTAEKYPLPAYTRPFFQWTIMGCLIGIIVSFALIFLSKFYTIVSTIWREGNMSSTYNY